MCTPFLHCSEWESITVIGRKSKDFSCVLSFAGFFGGGDAGGERMLIMSCPLKSGTRGDLFSIAGNGGFAFSQEQLVLKRVSARPWAQNERRKTRKGGYDATELASPQCTW